MKIRIRVIIKRNADNDRIKRVSNSETNNANNANKRF